MGTHGGRGRTRRRTADLSFTMIVVAPRAQGSQLSFVRRYWKAQRRRLRALAGSSYWSKADRPGSEYSGVDCIGASRSTCAAHECEYVHPCRRAAHTGVEPRRCTHRQRQGRDQEFHLLRRNAETAFSPPCPRDTLSLRQSDKIFWESMQPTRISYSSTYYRSKKIIEKWMNVI